MKFTRKNLGLALFLLTALLYFLPIHIPCKVCIPTFVLGAFSIGLTPWTITTALFLSALGDLSGSFKAMTDGDWAFIGQMLFFALAHVFYVSYFVISSLKNKGKREKLDGLYLSMVLMLCFIVFYSALTRIVPCVEDSVLVIGVTGYAVIITIMLFFALMSKDWIFGLGAALFVFSDYVLAWNMFVSDVPAQEYVILLSYYLAQLIIAGRAATKAATTAGGKSARPGRRR